MTIKKKKKKNYTQLGAQNEEKRLRQIELPSIVEKKEKRINKVRTTGRCIQIYSENKKGIFIY
jgi:hypothetical protein